MADQRRVNLRKILADPELRRELMVPTIQAIQAREGIETTREQAEHAYYVVTQAEQTAFFSLDRFRGGSRGEPDRRHEMFVRALRAEGNRIRQDVARRDFGAIEGHPLAYERVRLVAHIFREAPALDPAWGVAAQGLATAADERFVRCWWEVPSERRGQGRDWVPFAKGGEFSRFYADVYLVVLWRQDGYDIRRFEGAYIRNEPHYFKPGLTWPLAASVFNVRWLPAGCVFGHKGPAILPEKLQALGFLAGILNSTFAMYLLLGLTSRKEMGGRWEVGVVKRLPIPQAGAKQREQVGALSEAIHNSKATWDQGNEVSTHFSRPWLLSPSIPGDLGALAIPFLVDHLLAQEAAEEARICQLYADLNDEVYRLYGIPDSTRKVMEETLGKRPPEVLWPQMEGKSVEQKRMEHVWRLLSYAVKRVLEADDDGIVPFGAVNGEPRLVDRVRHELAALFPGRDTNQTEIEIVNELKRNVKGHRRCGSLDEWLDNAFYEYHRGLYKNRPIYWHIASAQGITPFAFGALVQYHRFDKNRIAKLRSSYLRDAIEEFRREAALADKAGRTDDRLEWQSKIEEARALDEKLQSIQEGQHVGPDGGERDFRILTPWKEPGEQPQGWDPDIDDGVKVNIAPFEKAGILRIGRVT